MQTNEQWKSKWNEVQVMHHEVPFIMILSPCALVFCSGCCLLCQWVLSPSFLTFSSFGSGIWFHIEVLISLVVSIMNGYRYGSICILLNTDLTRPEQLAENSFFNSFWITGFIMKRQGVHWHMGLHCLDFLFNYIYQSFLFYSNILLFLLNEF